MAFFYDDKTLLLSLEAKEGEGPPEQLVPYAGGEYVQDASGTYGDRKFYTRASGGCIFFDEGGGRWVLGSEVGSRALAWATTEGTAVPESGWMMSGGGWFSSDVPAPVVLKKKKLLDNIRKTSSGGGSSPTGKRTSVTDSIRGSLKGVQDFHEAAKASTTRAYENVKARSTQGVADFHEAAKASTSRAYESVKAKSAQVSETSAVYARQGYLKVADHAKATAGKAHAAYHHEDTQACLEGTKQYILTVSRNCVACGIGVYFFFAHLCGFIEDDDEHSKPLLQDANKNPQEPALESKKADAEASPIGAAVVVESETREVEGQTVVAEARVIDEAKA